MNILTCPEVCSLRFVSLHEKDKSFMSVITVSFSKTELIYSFKGITHFFLVLQANRN